MNNMRMLTAHLLPFIIRYDKTALWRERRCTRAQSEITHTHTKVFEVMQSHVWFMCFMYCSVRGERCEIPGCLQGAHPLLLLCRKSYLFFLMCHSLSSSLHLSPLFLYLRFIQGVNPAWLRWCWTVSPLSTLQPRFNVNLASVSFSSCLLQVCFPKCSWPHWGLRRSEPSPGPDGTPGYPACTAVAAVHAGPAAWRRGQ